MVLCSPVSVNRPQCVKCFLHLKPKSYGRVCLFSVILMINYSAALNASTNMITARWHENTSNLPIDTQSPKTVTSQSPSPQTSGMVDIISSQRLHHINNTDQRDQNFWLRLHEMYDVCVICGSRRNLVWIVENPIHTPFTFGRRWDRACRSGQDFNLPMER